MWLWLWLLWLVVVVGVDVVSGGGGVIVSHHCGVDLISGAIRSDPLDIAGVLPGVAAGTPGLLFVGVHSAAGLPAMDRDGLADPYAKVKVVQGSVAGGSGSGGGTGGSGGGGGATETTVFQTQVVDNTRDPVWDDAANRDDQPAGNWR